LDGGNIGRHLDRRVIGQHLLQKAYLVVADAGFAVRQALEVWCGCRRRGAKHSLGVQQWNAAKKWTIGLCAVAAVIAASSQYDSTMTDQDRPRDVSAKRSLWRPTTLTRRGAGSNQAKSAIGGTGAAKTGGLPPPHHTCIPRLGAVAVQDQTLPDPIHLQPVSQTRLLSGVFNGWLCRDHLRSSMGMADDPDYSSLSLNFNPQCCTGDLGGPDVGGHHGSTEWYIKFGMDLAAQMSTEVSAVVDGHVTVFHPHKRSADTSKVFGAQVFIRSKAAATGRDFSDDKLSSFYTHITDVPASLHVGSFVRKGDRPGKLFHAGATHLQLALVEIIGGAPGGRYKGINIFKDIRNMAMAPTAKTLSAMFKQSDSPPAATMI
jgi:murein DD-endopeptidase MepM/ murein hydrolase activator NlpD